MNNFKWCFAYFLISISPLLAGDRTPLLQEDFTRDTRKNYVVEKPEGLRWKAGALVMSDGAGLSKEVAAETELVMQVKIQAPTKLPPNTPVKFQCRMYLDQTPWPELTLTGYPRGENIEWSATLGIRRPGVPKQYEPADVSQSHSVKAINGTWKLKILHNEVELFHNSQRVTRFFLGTHVATRLERITVSSTGSAVELQSLEVTGRKVDQKWNSLTELQELVPLLEAVRVADDQNKNKLAFEHWTKAEARLKDWPSKNLYRQYQGHRNALILIKHGQVKIGLNRLSSTWAVLAKQLPEDHPWFCAADATLREAIRQCESLPVNAEQLPGYLKSLDTAETAWKQTDWQGRKVLLISTERLKKRWKDLAGLSEQDRQQWKQARGLLASALFRERNGEYQTGETEANKSQELFKQLSDGHAKEFLLIDRSQALTAMAKNRFWTENWNAIRPALEEANRLMNQAVPEEDPLYLITLFNMAGVNYLDGHWEAAHREGFQAAYDLAHKIYPKGSPELLEYQTGLGWMIRSLGDQEQAREILRTSVNGYARLARAGWLQLPAYPINVFAVRQNLVKHPTVLITFFSAAAPGIPKVGLPLTPWNPSLSVAEMGDRMSLIENELDFYGASAPPWPLGSPGNLALLQRAELLGKTDSKTMLAWWNRGGAVNLERIIAGFSAEHPAAIQILRTNGTSPTATRKSGRSAEQFDQAVAALMKAKKSFGEDHPETAWCHEVLSVLCYLRYQDHDAARHARLAMAGFSRPTTRVVRRALQMRNTLGIIQYDLGDLSAGFQNLATVVQGRMQLLGNEHHDTLCSLNDLAVVARASGNYPQARAYLEQAVEAWEKRKINPLSYDVRSYDIHRLAFFAARINLHVLQAENGDFEMAAQGFREILEQGPAKTREPAMLSLASVLILQKKLKEAEALYRKLLKDNPKNNAALHAFGVLKREQKQFDEARKYLALALENRTAKTFGEPITAVGDTQVSLAILEMKVGNYQEAIRYLGNANASYRKLMGANGMPQADTLRRFALILYLQKKDKIAIQAAKTALNMKSHLAHEIGATLSEAEALLFARTLTELEPLLSAYRQNPVQNASFALEAVWQSRSILTTLLQERHSQIYRNLTPKAEQMLEELKSVRRQLATLFGPQFNNPRMGQEFLDNQKSTSLQSLAMKREELTKQKEDLQRKLSAFSQTSTTSRIAVKVADLAKRLPPDSALVEFVKVNTWDRTAAAKGVPDPMPVYDAFVLRFDKQGQPIARWYPLGDSRQIDPLIDSWRKQLLSEKTQRERGMRRREPIVPVGPSHREELFASLWKPLAESLQDCRHVYVVPDGALHRLPWAALPSSVPGKLLIETCEITLLDRGSSLSHSLEPKQKPNSIGKVLLVGNIHYNTQPNVNTQSARVSARRAPVGYGAELNWSSLMGTKTELDQIATLFAKSPLTRLEEEAATETAVQKSLMGSNWVHIATHGFFSDPRFTSGLSDSSWDDLNGTSDPVRNPLALCGLVVAHANQLPQRDASGLPIGPDGILTGEELCDLDLSQVDLVVLSACETGLGQVASGEGAWGLTRALSLAGAKFTVTSLWKVDDRATAVLMTEFYRGLLKGQAKSEALRLSQQRMIHHYDPATGTLQEKAFPKPLAPYFWAGFVLTEAP